MDWAVIIAAIVQLIQECQKKDGPEVVAARLRHPTMRERFVLRMHLRRIGLFGLELDTVVADAMEVLGGASDDEINQLLGDETP
jgi:hypothetical protein